MRPPADTSQEAWAVQRAALARMGPDARVRIALELSESIRAIQLAGVRARSPHLSQAGAVRELVATHLGVELPDQS